MPAPHLAAVGLLAAFAVAAGACAAFAGAFTQEPGRGQAFVSAYHMTGGKYYDGDGKRRSRDRYRKSDLQFYGEYGLREGLTALAAATLQRIALEGARDRTGLGRAEVGLRAKLAEPAGWIVSVQSSVIIAGARSHRGPAAIGEDDDQVDARLLVARSFEAFGRSGFFDLQAGYRTRSDDPADEVRIDATLGLRPTPAWLLVLQSFNTIGQGRWSGPLELKQRIHKVQAAVYYDATPEWTLHVAAFATPEARDAMDERGIVVGMGYRF